MNTGTIQGKHREFNVNPNVATLIMTPLIADINIKDFVAVSKWCKEKTISLVVIGPEDPLANGIADVLKENGTDII